MQTQLLKSYLRNVLIFSERLNLNYIESGNLKVAENMKSLVSDAIAFLVEDVKNITKLDTVENADVIKEFSLNNIERLRKILLVI